MAKKGAYLGVFPSEAFFSTHAIRTLFDAFASLRMRNDHFLEGSLAAQKDAFWRLPSLLGRCPKHGKGLANTVLCGFERLSEVDKIRRGSDVERGR